MKKLFTLATAALCSLAALGASPGIHYNGKSGPSLPSLSPVQADFSSLKSMPAKSKGVRAADAAVAPDSPVGLYKFNFYTLHGEVTNPSAENTLQISEGLERNHFNINGLYSTYTIDAKRDSVSGALSITGRQFLFHYSPLDEDVNLYCVRQEVDSVGNVKWVEVPEMVFDWTESTMISGQPGYGQTEVVLAWITTPSYFEELLAGTSTSAFTSMYYMGMVPMDEYLADRNMKKVFQFDPMEWEGFGAVTYVDPWISPILNEPYSTNAYCLVNKENRNLILLNNPYYGLTEDIDSGGQILFDISDPEHVLVMPMIYSGLDFTELFNSALSKLYLSNYAGQAYYNSPEGISKQDIFEELGIEEQDWIPSTFSDNGTITIKDASFATVNSLLSNNYWVEDDGSKINAIGSVQLTKQILDYISEGNSPVNPDDPTGTSFYIIGENVNGAKWELADPNGLFSKTETAGVYRWQGQTLGTGFKINDGTWDNAEYNIGADYSDEGLTLGEPFQYVASANSTNIAINDGTLVLNPTVILNTNNATITVTGEVDGSYKWYLPATFNDNNLNTTSQLIPVEGDNDLFLLANVAVQGEGTLKVATDGYTLQYGLTNPGDSINPLSTIYLLEEVSPTSGDVPYKLDGIYDFSWRPSKQQLAVTRTGDYIAPPADETAFYVIGENVNGAKWELADPNGKFSPTETEGVYEWTGTVLGTGFKINDGSWDGEHNIGASSNAGDELTLGVLYTYTDGYSAQNIAISDGTLVNKPHIILDTNNGTILLTGEVEGSYHWYLPATFNDNQISEESELAPVEGEDYLFRLSGVSVQGEGTLKVASDGYTRQFGMMETEIFIVAESATYTLDETFLQHGDTPYELDGTYDFTWNLATHELTVTRTGDYDTPPADELEFYIIGQNVNGKEWEIADPDSKFTKIEEGLYEWTGTELGTGFKINDGSWEGEHNIGASPVQDEEFGLTLGEPYFYTDAVNSQNIAINLYTVVHNPKVILNTVEGTLTITGEGEGTYKWYLPATFNDFVFDESSELVQGTGNSAEYYLTNVAVRGTGTLKVSTDGYATQYGDMSGMLLISEPDTYQLQLCSVQHGNVTYDLDGRYDFTWNAETKELIVYRLGDYPVTPDPDKVKVTVNTVNGINYTLGLPTGSSMSLQLDLDEFWAIKSLLFNGNDNTALVENNGFTTPVLTENSTIECVVEYIGELEVIDANLGKAEIGNGITVYVSEGSIFIEGLEGGEEIVVYNLGGQVVTNTVATSESMKITLAQGNAYIVRVNANAAKVML